MKNIFIAFLLGVLLGVQQAHGAPVVRVATPPVTQTKSITSSGPHQRIFVTYPSVHISVLKNNIDRDQKGKKQIVKEGQKNE